MRERPNALSVLGFGGGALVSVQNAMQLSPMPMPEPDLQLLRDRPNHYRAALPGPGDMLLLTPRRIIRNTGGQLQWPMPRCAAGLAAPIAVHGQRGIEVHAEAAQHVSHTGRKNGQREAPLSCLPDCRCVVW